MPYQPIRGGTIYNRKLAAARSRSRKIRQIIKLLNETGGDRGTINQALTAITLLTTEIDDVLEDLTDFDD